MGSYLILEPEDIRDLVTMAEAIEAIEKAYRDIAEWPLSSVPRQRVHSPHNIRLSAFSGGCDSMGVIGVAEHIEQISHTHISRKRGTESIRSGSFTTQKHARSLLS